LDQLEINKVNFMKNIYSILTIIILFSCTEKDNSKKLFFDSNITTNIKKEDSKNTVLNINSDDSMLYDKNVLRAESGKKIILTLNHTGKLPKNIMGHNLVLLKMNVDVNVFSKLALEFKNNDYIPLNEDFIAHTKMLGGGESDTISFTIDEPGEYKYVCTFPGHYQMMQGLLIIY